MQNNNQAVKQIDVGVEREEAAQHLAEQADVAAPGKAVAVERHLNLHAAYQVALLKSPGLTVLHVNNGFQATAVHLAVGPFIQRQGAAQHVGIIHHRQKPAAEVAQHAPVKTVLCRGIAGQRRRTQVTHGDAGRGAFHHRIQHGAL